MHEETIAQLLEQLDSHTARPLWTCPIFCAGRSWIAIIFLEYIVEVPWRIGRTMRERRRILAKHLEAFQPAIL
jgi:hypothetical protein